MITVQRQAVRRGFRAVEGAAGRGREGVGGGGGRRGREGGGER